MILGAFVSDRPFVVGRVFVETVTPQGAPYLATADIPFLVDTGADVTMIKPDDYETRLGLRTSAAPLGMPSVGLGGSVAVHEIAGILFLLDNGSRWVPVPLTFHIPEPLPGSPVLPFSLLGRDVWGQGSLNIDKPKGVLTLDLSSLGPHAPEP